MNDASPKHGTTEVARAITDELAEAGVKLVASLPDNWIHGVIQTIDADPRIRHVPVNREESAIGLCSGLFMSGMDSCALMGASGFMTVIYAITKINYTYEIPLFLMITLRGAPGDHHKHHVSNGLYLKSVMDAISIPYEVVDKAEDIPKIGRMYHHSRTFSRPTVIALTRDLLRGRA
jgi:sulfopyruvate decarboxylase subunit alpha